MEDGKTLLREDTRRIQSSLALYCKTGIVHNLEGVNVDRLPNYRRLVFNIIFDIMTNAYPITRQIFDNKWKAFLEQFFIDHDCKHYQVWQLPEELLNYVKINELPEKIDYPFLEDLLTFEWLEIVIYNETDKHIEAHSTEGDWKKSELLINPHHMLIELNYPIHKFKAYESIEKVGKYHVLIFRDLQKLQVRFIEIPIFFKSVIEELARDANLYRAIIKTSKKFELSNSDNLLEKTHEWMLSMIQKGFILGFKN